MRTLKQEYSYTSYVSPTVASLVVSNKSMKAKRLFATTLVLGSLALPASLFSGQVLLPTIIVDTLEAISIETDSTCTAVSNDCSLEEAIAIATSGDVIEIDSTLSGDINISETLSIANKDITIQKTEGGSVYVNGYLGADTFDNILEINNSTVTISGIGFKSGAFNYQNSKILAGAITVVDGSNLTLSKSVIKANNVAFGSFDFPVSGIFIENSQMTLKECSITSNSYIGIFATHSTVGIIDSNITDNGSVGLIASEWVSGTSYVDINNTTIYNNTSDGVRIEKAEVNIINSTISGNEGKGVQIDSGEVNVTNSTIYNNYYGGFVSSAGSATINVANSVISGNSMSDCNSGGGSLVSQGHNFVGSSCAFSESGDVTGSNPMLGELADNGGPTFTHMPEEGSPLVDAGSNSLVVGIAYDQRGEARIYNDITVDIGAVESSHIPTVYFDLNITLSNMGDKNITSVMLFDARLDDNETNSSGATGFTSGQNVTFYNLSHESGYNRSFAVVLELDGDSANRWIYSNNGVELASDIDWDAIADTNSTHTYIVDTDNNTLDLDLSSWEDVTKYIVTNGADSGVGTLRYAVDTVADYGVVELKTNVTFDFNSLELSGKKVSIVGSNSQKVQIKNVEGSNIVDISNGSIVTFKNIRFEDSSLSALDIQNSTVKIDKSEFINNGVAASLTTMSGGALYMSQSTVSVTNSLFYGNKAFDGGAIYQYSGTLNISSSTIVGNTSGISSDQGSQLPSGGGIYVKSGTTKIKNSILTGNSDLSSHGPNCYTSGSTSITSLGYNIFGDKSDCSVSSASSDKDATTLSATGIGIDEEIQVTIASDSLIINNGTCTDISGNTLTEDLYGSSRPVGSSCDIGAIESSYTVNCKYTTVANLDFTYGNVETNSSATSGNMTKITIKESNSLCSLKPGTVFNITLPESGGMKFPSLINSTNYNVTFGNSTPTVTDIVELSSTVDKNNSILITIPDSANDTVEDNISIAIKLDLINGVSNGLKKANIVDEQNLTYGGFTKEFNALYIGSIPTTSTTFDPKNSVNSITENNSSFSSSGTGLVSYKEGGISLWTLNFNSPSSNGAPSCTSSRGTGWSCTVTQNISRATTTNIYSVNTVDAFGDTVVLNITETYTPPTTTTTTGTTTTIVTQEVIDYVVEIVNDSSTGTSQVIVENNTVTVTYDGDGDTGTTQDISLSKVTYESDIGVSKGEDSVDLNLQFEYEGDSVEVNVNANNDASINITQTITDKDGNRIESKIDIQAKDTSAEMKNDGTVVSTSVLGDGTTKVQLSIGVKSKTITIEKDGKLMTYNIAQNSSVVVREDGFISFADTTGALIVIEGSASDNTGTRTTDGDDDGKSGVSIQPTDKEYVYFTPKYPESNSTTFDVVSANQLFGNGEKALSNTSYDAVSAEFTSSRNFITTARRDDETTVVDSDAEYSFGSENEFNSYFNSTFLNDKDESSEEEVWITPNGAATFQEVQEFEGSRYVILKSGTAEISLGGSSFIMEAGEVYNLPGIKKDIKNIPMIVNRKYGLNIGWNLLSVLKDKTISDFSEKFRAVYIYGGDHWILNPEEIKRGSGVWVYSDEDVDFSSDIASYSLSPTMYELEGWQLLGAGKDIEGDSVNSLTNVSYVYSKERWLENPETIYKGQGFWVFHRNKAVIENGSLQLQTGWNLISNVSEDDLSLGMYSAIKVAYTYSDGDWDKENEKLESGKAYMINVESDTEIALGNLIENGSFDIDEQTASGFILVPCLQAECKVDYEKYNAYVLQNGHYIKNPTTIYMGQSLFVEIAE